VHTFTVLLVYDFDTHELLEEDNTLCIQQILEHLIRNQIQLRKLTLSHAGTPAQNDSVLQFMEAATQNPKIEDLSFRFIPSFPVSHFAQFFV